jgi:hypothetical protein
VTAHPKRPRDPNQIAKSISDRATGGEARPRSYARGAGQGPGCCRYGKGMASDYRQSRAIRLFVGAMRRRLRDGEPSMHSSEPPPMRYDSSNLTNAQTSSLTPDTAWIKRNLL